MKQGCDGNGNEIRRDEGESSEILWNVEQVCHACSHNKYEAELLLSCRSELIWDGMDIKI